MKTNITETIKESARNHKILRIIYLEKDGSRDGWRHIEPYSFRGEGHEKALFAWDIGNNGIRRFTLGRIEQAEVTNGVYHPRYSIELF